MVLLQGQGHTSDIKSHISYVQSVRFNVTVLFISVYPQSWKIYAGFMKVDAYSGCYKGIAIHVKKYGALLRFPLYAARGGEPINQVRRLNWLSDFERVTI